MDRIRRRRIRRPSEFSAELKSNWKFFFLSFLFLLGMLIGSLVVRFGGATSSVSGIFDAYFSGRSGQPFYITAGYSALSVLPFLAAAFLSGLCLCGAPVALMIPLFRGLGLGLMGGYIYAAYGLQGVGFYALIVLPPCLVSSIALVLACREALSLSAMLFSLALPKAQPFKLWGDVKVYCKRFLLILAVTLVSVAVDTVMTVVFIRFFTF